MPSVSGWGLQDDTKELTRGLLAAMVSMPSVSGWGLQGMAWVVCLPASVSKFLYPRGRAGVCKSTCRSSSRTWPFLCPRCRAGVCKGLRKVQEGKCVAQFLCPWCRAGVCKYVSSNNAGSGGLGMFLCPWRRAGVCKVHTRPVLGYLPEQFLCPRCRAGVCKEELVRLHLAPRTAEFLCPRCRAGVCKRCPLEGVLTCAFVALCVKLPEIPGKTAAIGGPSFRRPLTSHFRRAERARKHGAREPLYQL